MAVVTREMRRQVVVAVEQLERIAASYEAGELELSDEDLYALWDSAKALRAIAGMPRPR